MKKNKQYHPPRLAQQLLFSFLRTEFVEEVTGDLDEKFYLTVNSKSAFAAKLNYWYQVFKYLRPFAVRNLHLFHYSMIRSNFKMSVRSLWKHKVSTLINVSGLTIGLSACLLIALYIQNEASFDNFQPNANRIARVIMEYKFDGSSDEVRGNFTSTKVAPVFSRTFPEVQAAVRMDDGNMGNGGTIVWQRDEPIRENNFMYADSSFFDVFSYTWIEGNEKTALDGAFKIVLTKSSAEKYFGNESPLGKVLLVGSDKLSYEVTGVMEDYPDNSQFTFDFLASFSSLKSNQEKSYFNANYTTYLLLHDAQARIPLQDKIAPFMKKEMEGSGASVNFLLEPFDQIHLHSPYTGFVPTVDIKYLYVLGAAGLLILIIVCFTYINLSTARSIERAKEVGVRKTVGAAKSQLFWQFIGDSALIFTVAVILSIFITILALPFFNQITGKQLQWHYLLSAKFLISALCVTFTVSLLAGSYPAVIIAGFKPVKVLKGVFKNSDSGKLIQKSLMVFQFSISAFLIISTFIIQKQLHFIQNKNLGYNRDQIMVLPMSGKLLEDLPVIKQQLKSNANIKYVSRCVSTPVSIIGGYSMRSAEMSKDHVISVSGNPVDEEYIRAVGLQLITGRDFSEQDMKDVSGDHQPDFKYHYILNERAAKELGWTAETALGKNMFVGDHRPGTVEGIIKDFHFESLHNTIKPLVLFTENRGHGNVLIKVNTDDLKNTIAFIEQKWKALVPYMPFEYRFMDDDYNKLYLSEQNLGTIMNLFASIAIILACTGLFGLSSFIVHQRIKEVSIRKVLGASLPDIVRILSGNFAKLVLLSIITAMPVAYFFIQLWLEEFVYRTEISWWAFVAAGAMVFSVVLITISFQTIKAAFTNPVRNLKTE